MHLNQVVAGKAQCTCLCPTEFQQITDTHVLACVARNRLFSISFASRIECLHLIIELIDCVDVSKCELGEHPVVPCALLRLLEGLLSELCSLREVHL